MIGYSFSIMGGKINDCLPQKEKLLSLGGRITLLNASFSVSLLYFLSYFELLKWVEKKLIEFVTGSFGMEIMIKARLTIW